MKRQIALALLLLSLVTTLYCRIGSALDLGINEPPTCDKELHSELAEGVKNENADALFKYGILRYRGICVEQSNQQAFLFFMKSAEKGHVSAYYNVALMYHLGIGVEQNTKLAAEMLNLLLDIKYLPAGDYICNLKFKHQLRLDALSLDKLIEEYDLKCDS